MKIPKEVVLGGVRYSIIGEYYNYGISEYMVIMVDITYLYEDKLGEMKLIPREIQLNELVSELKGYEREQFFII